MPRIPKGDFEVRGEWEWCYLGDLGEFINGDRSKNYPSKVHQVSEGIPFINAGHLARGTVDFVDMNYITEERFELLKSGKVTTGDILYCLRGSLGKSGIVGDFGSGAIASSLVIIRLGTPAFNRYVLAYLNSPHGQRLIREFDNGTAQPNLSASDVRTYRVPLPPLPEQKRIVEKVDQLMALCDELEAAQKQKREKAVAFNHAALNAVVHASDKAALASSWSRLQDHFEVLYELPENVKQLRQTILQLAVMGKLVQQQSTESAEALMRRIVEGRADIGQRLGIRPSAPGQQEPSSVPLPKGWSAVRLADLGVFIGGGTPSKSNSEFWSGSIPWVSPKDMKVLELHDSIDHVSELAIKRSAAKLIPQGALLCVVRGMILAHSFPVAINRVPVTINQDMKAIIPGVPEMLPYLLLVLRGLKMGILALVERSSHGTCRLDSAKLGSVAIPLPCLGEQERIVNKTEQLMGLCDGLESQIAQSRDLGPRLMRAVVESLVA